MSSIGKQHQELNADGIGKCSVPMWMCGSPCGFCDEDAYGIPPRSSRIFNYGIMEQQRTDGRYDGYVPALACPGHGGPRSRVYKDGNMFCAVFPDFVNLQESDAGFGATVEEARAELCKLTGKEAR
jgi:hypothetical protein